MLKLKASLAAPAPPLAPAPPSSPSCLSSSPPLLPPASSLPSPHPPSPPSGSAVAPARQFPLAGAPTPMIMRRRKEKRVTHCWGHIHTLFCSATLAGRGEREERPSPRRTSTIKRERRERRRARREEVTLEEMLGTSFPPVLPLATYFTPPNLPPLSMPAVPIMGSELFSGG